MYISINSLEKAWNGDVSIISVGGKCEQSKEVTNADFMAFSHLLCTTSSFSKTCHPATFLHHDVSKIP